ncbi:type IV pilus biogenesis/stability protein PilW [Allofranklinella schreckenbergeri]|uniref:Type IV pilus biogenesis/stability protein PilW n=2 Tax=Allofranklinella schreckenbergeri TaxID=1076744 RepID=A0A3M6Q790_9BURK|nr:type IV pilus biogenesis/stability protein PilW [Allofranklinella schreckenbergeri]RRD40802.1 type IV pilus biogenesis/stability protein PilW [Comamonadaceae bacterium OH3737_COT-264]
MSKKAWGYGARHIAMAMLACVLGACETSRVTSTVHPGADGALTVPRSSADVRRAAQTRLELAAEYLRVGRNEVAIEEANQALALDSGLTDAYMVRGMAHAQRGDYVSAEADFSRILRAKSNDPDVLHNYGGLLCQLRRFDEAITYFERVLAMPGQAAAARTLMAKGLCLQGAGQTRAAVATLEQAYRVDPRNPVVAYNLAKMHYDAGQVSQAQIYLRPLNSSDMANAETLWLGIKVENAMGNLLGVRELGSALVQRFPQARETTLYERGAFYE